MMKKVLILATILTSSLLLASCSNKSQTDIGTSSSTVANSSSSQETPASSGSVSDEEMTGTQLVGSEDYGFVKVPESWIRFREVEGGNDIQYCDGTDLNIVTLNTYRADQFGVSDEEYAKLDIIHVSNNILTSREKSSEFSKVWGSKSTIGGYDAYVVNAIATSGKYLITWIFRSDDGKIRYVALEGDAKTLKVLLPMVEKSWTNKKLSEL